MIWLIAVPLIYSGFFLHAACVAPDGSGLVHSGMRAAGQTMATVGALAVLA